jgi:putative ABC transport system permease protein
VRVQTELVSPNYLGLLGVVPAMGRGFAAAVDGGAPPLVLAHELWESRLGGAPDAVGRTVRLDGVMFEVAGIAPAGFRGQTGDADAWVPIDAAPALMNNPGRLTQARANWAYVIGRPRAGAPIETVEAELDVIAGRLRVLRQESGPEARGVALLTLEQATTDPRLRRTLVLLLGAAGMVLLIACANLANLLLVRALGRRREIALRRALGAGRRRLFRQLLTESLLLGLAGGAAALLVAWTAVGLLALLAPAEPAGFAALHAGVDFARIGLDARVLAFNFTAAVLCAAAFGLAPAVWGTRVDVAGVLRDSPASRNPIRARPRGGGRRLLVSVQLALAMVLLTAAGLLLESLARLRSVDTGFRGEDVLAVALRLPPQRYDAAAAAGLYRAALERLRALPGVAGAAVATSLPVSSNSGTTVVEVDGRPARDGEDALTAGYHLVSDGYFETLGIRVLRGRAFHDGDRAGGRRVAVINETAARRFFPGADPVGRRLWLGAGYGPREDLAEVVGVVADVKYGPVEEPARAHAYLSAAQYMEDAGFLLVRSRDARPAALLPGVRAELAALDPALPLFDARTMEQRVAQATSRTRFGAALFGAFAVLALALAAVGVYGVASFAVTARTHELGIRRALGAPDGTVLLQAMRDGGVVALAGIALGAAGALAGGRLLESQLYGVAAVDARTLALVAASLLATALTATWIPSRRATRVDPLRALKGD